MNPPRAGKKCLVLDIDYTLFDHRSTVEVHDSLLPVQLDVAALR
jgi:ubiquitin-like domain-containing CTD phosphatase 1